MSSLTNINNSSSVVNVGRTVPVSTGQTTSDKSIPVVVASDQSPIPVIEQNKIQSEVALSLLGIPRSEVALGIFADVNTYDVNPTEWSTAPEVYTNGYGTKHSPSEAGAIVEAPRDKTAVLTSKRFFRYQPGRVSSATFGIKCSVSNSTFAQNQVIKKYGIFDKYDGYYWETRQNGQGDNFSVVRRTQSLYKNPTSPFGLINTFLRGEQAQDNAKRKIVSQTEDYRIVGTPPTRVNAESTLYLKQRKDLINSRFEIADTVWNTLINDSGSNALKTFYNGLATQALKDEFESKCKRDVDFWIDMYLADLAASETSTAHTAINTRNYETSLAVINKSAAAEIALHTQVRNYLVNTFFNSEELVFKDRLTSLLNIPVTFFESVSTTALYPTPVYPAAGLQTRFEIMFNVRKHYWAYIISTYESVDNYGPTSTFVNSTKTTYPSTPTISGEEIRYKCHRDLVYVIEGYRDDALGGGNGATKYNASMYYKGLDYSVFTLKENGLPKELTRHTNLKTLITRDLNESYYGLNNNAGNYRTTVQTLADLIIENFRFEDTTTAVYGERAVAGNLVVLRDGLIITHAAVYDSSLLKDAKSIKVKIVAGSPVKFKLVEDVVTFGQHIRYFGATNGDLVNNKLYKVSAVYGPKSNEFSIKDTTGADITVANANPLTPAVFQLVNPFIIPDVYDPEIFNIASNYNAIGAMFPYKYTQDGILPQGAGVNSFGYIDTALNTTIEAESNELMIQIDSVNFIPEYINWIKNNVKPEYYGVYEYRIPRSRFSTDQLNGELNTTVYSDVATGDGLPVRPGQIVRDVTGSALRTQSVYDFDFTKVTMVKIEFSWYGAVGALFLAYVPVGNGEARWVRVHHLRASNQLKIASLGNATLPITYLVYGGGNPESLGDGESTPDYGYGRGSHNLVKYGASYYIDGGDRGTVRLYSYNNNIPVKAYGKQLTIGTVVYVQDTTLGLWYFERNDASVDPKNVFFMNGKIKTNSRIDQNIKIVWTTNTRIYLSKKPENTNVTIIPDRANTVYGLETKREIISSDGARVRNRVQVYPTKMSTANLSTTLPVRLRMKKTPRFQTTDTVSGTFTLTAEHIVTSDNLELPVAPGSATYLDNDESVFGWFRGRLGIDRLTVFGRLYRVANSYFFELLETYNGTITLLDGNFMYDLRFNAEGQVLTGVSKTTEEKEGLSSVEIATQDQVAIPGTGIDVATLYLKPGTEQIDLSSYYDYNKEYLSYPLTDVADSLYLAVDTESNYALPTPSAVDISISITWEEQ
jgi:hypothetical protein